MSPLMLSIILATTVGAIIGGAIFSRPQMQPFPPATSIVRTEPQFVSQILKGNVYVPSSSISKGTIRTLEAHVTMTTKTLDYLEPYSDRQYHAIRPNNISHGANDEYLGILEDETLGTTTEMGWLTTDWSISSEASSEILPKVQIIQSHLAEDDALASTFVETPEEANIAEGPNEDETLRIPMI